MLLCIYYNSSNVKSIDLIALKNKIKFRGTKKGSRYVESKFYFKLNLRYTYSGTIRKKFLLQITKIKLF